MSIQELSQKLIDDMKTILEGGTVEVKEDNTNDNSDDGEGLDKVQPKAVKKKFKDRKDKDIDNDGDTDDSDEFLHKKRKAISKAVAQDESVEDDNASEGYEGQLKRGTSPKFDGQLKKNQKKSKGGKYLKYSNLLLKKQRMPKGADMTAINKEIKKERQHLGITEQHLEDLLIHYLPEQED
jgi:CRISPR/Cas system CMR-associated protein Cmr3 (group 5 of RAMP superfamily)